MKEGFCEGCDRLDELTYNRYAGMDLCDFCYAQACEEEDEKEWDDWTDNEY